MKHHAIGLSVLIVLGVSTTAPIAQGVDLFDVGANRQLLIDEAFFEEVENVRIRLHPARKTGEKVVQREHPWEAATLNWFSVMKDPGVVDKQARYRMWYECYDIEGWPTGDDTSFCYAESRNGVHWTKPQLDLFEFRGSKKNNILFRQIGPAEAHSRVHGTGVFKDATAPLEARYKAVSQGIWRGSKGLPHRIAGMFSTDGLKWARYPEPICDVFADSQYSGFWDSRVARYVIYGRVGGRGRALGRAVSDDFSHFKPLELVLQTDDSDPPNSDLYNPAAIKYAGAANVYLMFPSLFQHDTDTLDIRLAVSRDGVHWTWPQRDVAFIPLGQPGAFDSKTLYMGQGLLEAGEELWLYYSGSPLTHSGHDLDDLLKVEQPRAYSRVVIRRDRFASADSGPGGGYFVTPPLRFAGNVLKVNVDVRPGGRVRVALLDENGEPVPGHTVNDCLPISSNELAEPVRWQQGGDVTSLAGKPTRLRVELENASLYAFHFTVDHAGKGRDH
jgi:hypothetical protein